MLSKVGFHLQTKVCIFSYLDSNDDFFNYAQGHNRAELTDIKVCNFFEQATCLTKFHKNPDLNDYAHKCPPTCTNTDIHKEETSVRTVQLDTKILLSYIVLNC